MTAYEMTNGDAIPNNSKVIHFVVLTVCAAALFCVAVQGLCYLWKVPDMNTPLAGAFLHVTDTLIGALIAMLINTRPQPQLKQAADDGKTPPVVVAPVAVPTPTGTVKIEQPENNPIPVVEIPKP